jgi:hypothetical protein
VSGTVLLHMSMSRVSGLLRGPVGFWALAGVALLASHDAIFLVQIGPGERLTQALRETGHEYWASASLLLVAFGFAAAATMILRIRSLRRQALDIDETRGAAWPSRRRASPISAWTKLFALVALGFAIQENIEHLVAHGHAPLLGALLGPEYPLALPVIAVITAIASILVVALRSTEHALVAAIEAALQQAFGHAPRRVRRKVQAARGIRISPMAAAVAGRAPPLAFAQAH